MSNPLLQMNKWSLSKCEKHTVEIGAHLFWSVPYHCLELRSCTFFSFPPTSQCMTWHYPDCFFSLTQRLFGPGLQSLGTPPTLSGILRLRPNHCSCSTAERVLLIFATVLLSLGENLWLFPRRIIWDLIQLTATGPIGWCRPSTSISHYGHYEQGEAGEKYRFVSSGNAKHCSLSLQQLSLGIRDASARVGLVSLWDPILDYIWNNSPEPWALIQDATRQLWECEERAKSRTLTIEGGV